MKQGMTKIAAAAALLALAACTTTPAPTATVSQQQQAVNLGIDATLGTLYATVPGSQELAHRARGILVFPKTYAAGLVLGGEYGNGALRVDGRTAGYYATTGVSLGLQAGAESRGLVFMFLTQAALDRFLAGDGWTAGVDASVAVARSGSNGTVDLTNPSAEVAAFALTNSGLMAAVNLESTKVKKLDVPVALQ